MLNSFGARVETEGTTATIEPHPRLTGQKIPVPGDISSAAYFLAAGCITPDSELLIQNVGINPTRDGILRVCQMMGADVSILPADSRTDEPTADLFVKTSDLQGCIIEGELKVKESNRIDVMTESLSAMGAHITATEDGMIIEGGYPLHGAVIDSRLDHRIAMSFAIAGMNADRETRILKDACVNISYPGFYRDLERLWRP